jgi:hypothetical protein
MKSFAKRTTTVVGGVAITAFLLTLAAPKVAHAVVSTLVSVTNTTANPVPTQQAIPGKPFFGTLEPDPSGGFAVSVGPGTSGTLAVTNITISNLGSVTQEVVVSAPTFAGGGTCGDASIGSATPSLQLLVPAAQTLSVSYPTPLVFAPINGKSCVAAQNFVSGEIEVYVTGFVQ